MNELNIPATVNTPATEYNPATGEFSIIGRCIPENPADFFSRINHWAMDNIPGFIGDLHLKMQLEYINSGSSKQILTFLRYLEPFVDNGLKAEVDWYYEEDDEAILELGEDLRSTLKFPVNLIVTE